MMANEQKQPADAVGSSEGLGVRRLPAQTPRVESGPTKFGDDWCGVFIRGDNAFHYAVLLRCVLSPTEDDADAVMKPIARVALQGLVRLLEASDERTHA